MFGWKRRREDQAEKDRIFSLYAGAITRLEQATCALRSAVLPSDRTSAQNVIDDCKAAIGDAAMRSGPAYDWRVEREEGR